MRLAAGLQRTNPFTVRSALEHFIQIFEVPFDPGVDPVDEWSKPLMVLHAMFETRRQERPSFQRFGGFGYRVRPEYVNDVFDLPVDVIDGEPLLIAWRGGYKGPAYSAIEHYEYFLEHGIPRDLSRYLE
jgi:hypothetical protein